MKKDPFKEYLKESEPDKAGSSDFLPQTIFLLKTLGILEMPLFGQIIRTYKRGFTKQQNTLKFFLEICF